MNPDYPGHNNRIIIFLSRHAPFYHFFRACARLQLFCTVAILRMLPVKAIILRRKNVLIDFAPGNSDYDLTCVMTDDAFRWKMVRKISFTLRIIQRLFPVIGEFHVVAETDFPRFFDRFWMDYYSRTRPYVLWQSASFPKSFTSTCTSAVIYETCLSIAYSDLWQSFFTLSAKRPPPFHQKIYARHFMKKFLRIERLLNYKDTAGANSNDSDIYQRQFNVWVPLHDVAMGLEKTLKQIQDHLPASDDSPQIDVHILSRNEPKNDPVFRLVQPWLNEKMASIKDLAESLLIWDNRLFRSQKMVVFILQDKYAENFLRSTQCHELLHSFHDSTKHEIDLFYYPYPIILPQRFLNKYLATQPLFRFFYALSNYDFIPKTPSRLDLFRVTADQRAICADLINTLAMLLSSSRKKDPIYLLDLIFGHLVSYRLLLQRRVIHGALESLIAEYFQSVSLSQRQHEIVEIYKNGNTSDVRALSTINIWKTFEDVILEECSLARTILAGERDSKTMTL